jgi:hypothetical protein
MEFFKRRSISRSELLVLGFTFTYMAISLSAAFALHNEEFLFYFVVMLVLIAATIGLHFRVGLHIGALWGLSIWGAAHMAGGLMPVPDSWPISGDTHVLYNWWLIRGLLKYDQVVHAYGFGLVTWICWQGLHSAFTRLIDDEIRGTGILPVTPDANPGQDGPATARGVRVRPTVGLLTLCVAAGNGFGAANEVVEFIATLTLPGTNVGGYTNTGWDMVSNLVGTMIAAMTIYVRGR